MKTQLNRRSLVSGLGAIAAGSLLGQGLPAFANAYPNRPIRWIVPYGAGGGTDTSVRLIGNEMAPILGGGFVFDNKPGGQTIIGTQALATSAADGYTIMTIVDNFPILPLMFDKLPFDIYKDFDFLSATVKVPFVLLVRADSPIKTAAEAIAAMKSSGDRMTYASYGMGSLAHLAMEGLCDRLDTQLTHVPYQGAAAMLTAMISGQVDIMFCDLPGALPFIKDGKIRALAIATKDRHPGFPSIPSIHEQGISDYNYYSWHGVIAPKGLPAPVKAKLVNALHQSLKQPKLVSQFAERGWDIFTGTPEDFTRHVTQFGASMTALVKKRKVTVTAK